MVRIDLGLVHGSCVDFNGKAILAVGPSGSGKSTFALELIALGGTLVSDDQTILTECEAGIQLTAPLTIAGQLEIRHIGILKIPYVAHSTLNLIVDLQTAPKARFVDRNSVQIGHSQVELINGNGVHNLSKAAWLLNLYGRNGSRELST